MKENDRVKWTDPVTGATKTGRLLEKNQVVATIPVDEAGFQGRMIDHEELGEDIWDWTILCDQDKKRYSFEEKDLELIKPN